jgi:hypothetical protein
MMYVRETRQGQELVTQPLAPAGQPCVLLIEPTMPGLRLPSVSPEGTHVAFPASEQVAADAGACGTTSQTPPPTSAEPSNVLRLASWLGLAPDIGWAHGMPTVIWTINLDGTRLTRVAALQEDEPDVTWSPDGTHVALFGTTALYVVETKGGQPQKLVDQGAYGRLDWTR